MNILGPLLLSVSILAASASEPAHRIVAFQWLPMNSHKVVLTELAKSLRQPGVVVEEVVAFADEATLGAGIAALKERPPALVLTFDDHSTEVLAKARPPTTVMALLSKNPAAFASVGQGDGFRFIALDSRPDPALVLRVARELRGDAKLLAFIYTKKYEPNERLGGELRALGAGKDMVVYPIALPSGFCQTEGNLLEELGNALEGKNVDFAYIPDDPNCSRFAPFLCQYLGTRGIPVLGSEAIIGQGCVAAIAQDYRAIGVAAAGVCNAVLSGEDANVGVLRVANRVETDEKALLRFGLRVPSWMKSQPEPAGAGAAP